MTPHEFKAWFMGYTEAMDKKPTEKQWRRVQEMVAKINDIPSTYYNYIGYYPAYHPQWWGNAIVTNAVAAPATNSFNTYQGVTAYTACMNTQMHTTTPQLTATATPEGFDVTNAMYALGMLEAKESADDT